MKYELNILKSDVPEQTPGYEEAVVILQGESADRPPEPDEPSNSTLVMPKSQFSLARRIEWAIEGDVVFQLNGNDYGKTRVTLLEFSGSLVAGLAQVLLFRARAYVLYPETDRMLLLQRLDGTGLRIATVHGQREFDSTETNLLEFSQIIGQAHMALLERVVELYPELRWDREFTQRNQGARLLTNRDAPEPYNLCC